MKRLEHPMSHEWHVAINRFQDGPEKRRPWMYEAKSLADEVPRLARLFRMARCNELPTVLRKCPHSDEVPIRDNYLTCCLGVKCAECPELLALEKMKRVTAEDIDAAKAWTCAAHIVSMGGDPMREGYVLTTGDRMYWDSVYENLSRGSTEPL